MDLRSLADRDLQSDIQAWEDVLWVLREREMPPPDDPDRIRPDEASYDTAVA